MLIILANCIVMTLKNVHEAYEYDHFSSAFDFHFSLISLELPLQLFIQ